MDLHFWGKIFKPDFLSLQELFGLNSCTGCPKKNYQLGKSAITPVFFGLFAFPRWVLKNSGSEDFKSVLTFQNWLEITGDISYLSCLPSNSVLVHIINPIIKSSIFST